MSLVLGTRFEGGILLANDPFTFDNASDFPQKALDFNKFYIPRNQGYVATAVGSSWVFHQLRIWLNETNIPQQDLQRDLPFQWSKFNQEWRNKRECESSQGIGTLRPLSNSLLILARSSLLEKIQFVESDGSFHETSSFISSGSGSQLIYQFLMDSGTSFKPNDSLSQCLDKIQICYGLASLDLYVIGLPSMVLVKSNRIIDITQQCAEIWTKCGQRYFSDLKGIALSLVA